MTNSEVIISCTNITKSYRKGDNLVTPLKELSLTVTKGDFLALMGPSGSGKTTLLNLIAGIDHPTAGELLVEGSDLAKMNRSQLTRWRRSSVGYIFQLYHLVPVLTAYENVEVPLLLQRMSRKERHQRVCFALELAGIADRADHYPRQLSGGQEQRVAIARALAADPPLLVADEPTGDLDKESADRILKLLRRLSNELQKTIVMVTHDPTAASFANRTLHLDKGQLDSRDN
ncbi:ABC transporter ATP-binding protein [bacterium M21]|nr:ABC transporter ATP-binding protein [bacterium M21]